MEKEFNVSLKTGNILVPVAAGIITNLAGGDIETAALVGAGIAGIVPAVKTAITAGTYITTGSKKTALAITGAGLAATLFISSICAGISAGSHKLTGLIKNNNAKPAIEQVDEIQK